MSRIINIVLTDLASEIMKHEEAMEIIINSKEDIDARLKSVKYHLGEIVKIEQMIEKWKVYTSNTNNNDK